MKFIFVATSITDPTRETFEELSLKSFRKIERLVDNKDEEAEIRLSVTKDGDEFEVTADVATHKHGNHMIKTKDRDIRRAVNEASKELKYVLTKDKDKKVKRRKGILGITQIFNS